ncbi:non-ribosomal peptide synthetase [Nocardia abscessus]|uniref:non-ribosomal peptide synthetase n=1 Tax=Nocardia abscessus TaxID=120957 RepID=UPI0006870FA0|nr:non-ribosomal peptide synthetase [Nocardia abscessus]MCC3331986.1 non-ribosomal peptide synthetase [Nocardia abscessus]
MPTREASAPACALELTPGLGPLSRRSGGGTAAVVLAGLAVYLHRRTGAPEVTVGYRSGTDAVEIRVEVPTGHNFRAVTAQVGALLRQRAPGVADGACPTAVHHDDGWRIGLPEAELPVFTRLFTRLVAAPATTVARVDLTTDEERARILRRGGPRRDREPHATTLTGFESHARRAPAMIALRSGAESITYGELDTRANRLARDLIRRGVAPDTVVGVAMARSVEAIVAVYAVLKAGGAYLPLEPGHPAERLERIIAVAGPVLVLSTRRDGFTTEAAPVHYLDESDAEDGDGTPIDDAERRAPLRPADLAYLMFTSGSTGVPKGVAVPHAAVVDHLAWMSEHIGLDETDTVLQKTPVTFDVSIWELFWPTSIGATLAIASPSAHTDPAELDRVIAAHAVTTLQFVPSTLSNHLNVVPGFPACVRRVLTIGETLTPALAYRFGAATPARLHNLYGPTEATGAVTGHPVSTRDSASIPIGALASNTRAYVLDSRLRPVPDDLPGELYLAGTQLARCYQGDPARTADRFVADPFHPGARLYRTGDIVRWNAATELLEYLGRADFQVKRHGVRIELGEVEAALAACATVAQAVAALRPDGRLLGYVVPVTGAACTADALRTELSRTLPAAMIPDAIVVLDAFPTTAAGKVDRAALPAPAAAHTPYRAPGTPVEQTVAEVFAQVLGRDRVGVDDSFFTLGGDSVMSILLVSRAKARGVHFTPTQVFEQRTVAGLAAVATTGAPGEDVLAELPGGGVGEMPPTPTVLALVERAESGGVGFDRYAQHMVLDLPAGISATTLRRVIGAVAAHHDMLRARLYRDAGGAWRMFADPPESFDFAAVVTRIDISAAGDAEEAAILVRATESATGRLDTANGIVLQCVWLDRGDGDRGGRLVVVIHHIAVDGVSWRILIPDFVAAWAQLESGRSPRLPGGGTSMRRWAHTLRERADGAELHAEADQWRTLAGGPDPLFTDRPLDPRVDVSATVRRIAVELDEATTSAVVTVLPPRYGTDTNTILLTAVAVAMVAWRGHRISAVPIRVEGHGRDAQSPGADLSRTVGWFTAAYPCRIDLAGIDASDALAGGPALADAVKTVKEQLLSVPGAGIGYGLLRYLGSGIALPTGTPQLSFTYLGAVSGAANGPWLPAALTNTLPVDSGLPADASIAIDTVVAGDRLRTGFSFPETLIGHDRVRAFADLFQTALRTLARHAADPAARCWTPSDFAPAGLRQSEIDRWERRYGRLCDIRALTPIQEKFAALAPADPDAVEVHTLQVVLTCTGTPDRARLHAAAQHVVDRHSSLRAAFVRDGGGRWRQLVTATAPIDVREVDLRERGTDLDDILAEEQVRSFDLRRPPLIRFLLIRVEDHRWMLSVTNHRLLLDGWSAPILLRNLLGAFALGSDAPNDVDDGFAVFLRWRAARDHAPAAVAWRDALHGLATPTLVAAPGATPRDPARSHAEHVTTLTAEQTGALSRFAAGSGVTLNTVLQYVWASVLGDLTGNDDVLFGTVVSGRPAGIPGIDTMVGSFINTVPVRVRRHRDRSIGARLRAVQAEQAALLDHHHVGLAEIEDATGVPVRGYFDTLLVFESYPVDIAPTPLTVGELVLTDLWSREITLFPLTATVWPGEQLTVVLNWHRDLIDDDLLRRAVTRLEAELELLATTPADGAGANGV